MATSLKPDNLFVDRACFEGRSGVKRAGVFNAQIEILLRSRRDVRREAVGAEKWGMNRTLTTVRVLCTVPTVTARRDR